MQRPESPPPKPPTKMNGIKGPSALLRVKGRALAYPHQHKGCPTMPEDDISQLSFEDALAELDQIVRGLEGGTLKLDAAVQAFERGVRNANNSFDPTD